MSTEERAFLLAIAAEPREDTPRLVYADWLDEHAEVSCPHCKGCGEHRGGYVMCDGNGIHDNRRKIRCLGCRGTGTISYPTRRNRAEFIRAQIELEHNPAPAGTGRHGRNLKLAQRAAELLRTHEEAWRLVPGDDRVLMRGTVPAVVQFSRGFPFAIACRLGDVWADDGPMAWAKAVVRWHPVEEFRVTDRHPYNNGAGYCWFNESRINPNEVVPRPAELPTPVFSALNAAHGISVNPGGVRWRGAGTSELAQTALARALAELAREEVRRHDLGAHDSAAPISG